MPEADAGAPEPVRFTPEQARELEANAQLRALVYDMANPVKAYKGKDITLHRVTTAHNALYVSDGARQTAKPKIIHEIDMHVLEALKMLGITGKDNLPNIYVIDSFEMGKNAAAAYNAITNILHLNLSVAIYGKNTIPAGMEIFACFEDDHSSYIHELIHWQDAQRFIKRYGEVTDENYSQYLQFINDEAKKKLDKLIESGYNIADLSDYAVDQYRKGKYYEAYTEYRVEQVMKEGFQ